MPTALVNKDGNVTQEESKYDRLFSKIDTAVTKDISEFQEETVNGKSVYSQMPVLSLLLEERTLIANTCKSCEVSKEFVRLKAEGEKVNNFTKERYCLTHCPVGDQLRRIGLAYEARNRERRYKKFLQEEGLHRGSNSIEETWSIQEMDKLKKYWNKAPKSIITKEFPNREWKEIKDKAKELGMRID